MTVENVAKVLGALTGIAVVAYGLGVLVLVRRLQVAGLPSHDTIAALPRDQLLASGTLELGYSALGALMAVALGNLIFLISNWDHRILLAAVVASSLLSFLFVPFNLLGLACLGLLVLLMLWLYLLTKRWWALDERKSFVRDLLGLSDHPDWSKRPMARASLLLAVIAVVLAVGRIWSFPANFDVATVTAHESVVERNALYVGSGAESVVLGNPGPPGRVTFLRPSSVTRIDLRDNTQEESYPKSLSSRLGFLPVTCFFPTCRLDP